jgi:large subunit ribosomal protein L9
MKVILLDNINNLGKRGEIKEVAEGYARNFLLPKKLVEQATAEAIEKIKQSQEKNSELEKTELKKLERIASEIKGEKIIIKAKTEKEKLFGSIGTKEISQELKKQDFDIDEKFIILKDPIKKIGEKELVIDFGKNIKTKITVMVEKA